MTTSTRPQRIPRLYPLIAWTALAIAGCSDPASDDSPAQPALGTQIERMGRPAINTALNATFESDTTAKNAAKDAYNAASAPTTWTGFVPEFRANLAILDSLDGTCGNQLLAGTTDRYSQLASILVDDQLYVRTTTGTCGTYLGLEGEVAGALAANAGGCGGRTPTDDVIDRSYSVLAAGILTGVDDTITSDGQPHDSATFPFLAPPLN